MERVTVRQIFQIVKDTFKKNMGLIILILVIQLATVISVWFVQTTVISKVWEQIFLQLLSGLAQTFLVQCPLYFAVYCYLTGRPFSRESTIEMLRPRAVWLLCLSLMQSAEVILFRQWLPELTDRLIRRFAPAAINGYLLLGAGQLLLWLIDLAAGIWLAYLYMTIVVSAPGEKAFFQKATKTLSESFGTRLKLIICVMVICALPAAVLMQFPRSAWNQYLWISVAFMVIQPAQMAILMSLLPKEKRKQLKKKTP